MNKDTYEFGHVKETLETYEWDDLWWEHTEREDVPRIAYIGDSISRGTRKVLNSLAEGRVCFDGFATSKALDNPCFEKALSIFAVQQNRCDVVLFNNGLHGWHLNDAEYADRYERMICFLEKTFAGAPLVVVLTTYLADPKQNERVLARNEVAQRIAEKHGCPILDFYAVSEKNSNLLISDGVHFEKEGYVALAEATLDFIRPMIQAN
jgi:lysophospholipase L1-like esterase